MEIQSISVCFVCKFCQRGFLQLDNFMIHKKLSHPNEFEITKWIVFEERIDGNCAINIFSDLLKFPSDDVPDPVPSNVDFDSVSLKTQLESAFKSEYDPPDIDEGVTAPIILSSDHKYGCDDRKENLASDIYSKSIINPSPTTNPNFNDFASDFVCENVEVISEECLDTEIVGLNDDAVSDWAPEFESDSIVADKENPQKQEASVVVAKQPTFNPYVRVKRLTTKELEEANCNANNISNLFRNEDELSCSNYSDSDIDFADENLSISSDSDSDFEPKTKSRRKSSRQPGKNGALQSNSTKRNQNQSKIPGTKAKSNNFIGGSLELFKFPKPESYVDSEPETESTTLVDWLVKQNARIKTVDDNGTPTNVILLDPDPISTDVGPITPSTPIRCKLCSVSLKNELELKIHVKNCWTHNKRRHRYCTLCDRSFFRPAYLKEHFVSIHGLGEKKEVERKYKCKICSKLFIKGYALNYHMESHKSPSEQYRPFECQDCGKTFRLQRHLRLHTYTHSEERPFKCSQTDCSFATKDYYNFKRHQRCHLTSDKRMSNRRTKSTNVKTVVVTKNASKNGASASTSLSTGTNEEPEASMFEQLPFMCDICGKGFRLRRYLTLHSVIHSVDKPFKCSYSGCAFSCKDRRGLKQHRKRHTSVNPSFFTFPGIESCESDTMPLLDWLTREKESSAANVILIEPDPTTGNIEPVTPDNPIKCKLCCANLTSEAEVKIHVRHCWLKNRKRHRYCVPCAKTYSSAAFLRNHCTNAHTRPGEDGRPKFQCEICSKEFLDQKYLNYHMESHLNREDQSRPFVCEVCGLSFRRHVQLTYHRITHTDARPFKCSIDGCSRSFKTGKYLRKHQNSFHTTDRPFSCLLPECDRKFKTKYEVNVHVRSHTGERRFVCTEANCGKKFTVAHSLRVHVTLKHGDESEMPRFECNLCNKVFHQKSVLQSHLRAHSEERPFKCSYEGCNVGYKFRSLLLEHERGHKGELSYQCDTCGRAYAKAKPFRRHMLLHEKSNKRS